MSRALTLAWRLLRAAAGIAAAAALLAGLPCLLARMTGSPLPRNWPGWQQVQRFFASPLSDGAIIRLLADAAWLLWAVFALSLVIELIAVTRGQPAPRLPAIAPVQALAAALAGATMMTALHVPRAGTRSAPPLHAALTSATSISAPLVPGHTAQPTAASQTAGRAVSGDSTGQARPKVYRVREGDDLWDIAQRFLGDAEDWHQIYQLNEGKPQPDGRTLTDPDLIIPGWVLLIPQPASAHAPAPHPGRPGTTAPGGGRTPEPSPRPSRPSAPSPRPSQSAGPTVRPSRTSPSQGPPASRSAPSRSARPPQVAVRLPSGALIGIAVAVMVAAALTLAAVQRRRRYRPRPGPPSSLQPDTPPLPEVITALRRAARPDDLATPDAPASPAEDAGTDPYPDLYDPRPEPGPLLSAPASRPARRSASLRGPAPAPPGAKAAATENSAPGLLPLGVRDDSEVAVDIAALGGLGLTGPGAPAAARAILAGLLAQAPPAENGLPARIIIPAPDAARLLPGTGTAAVPGIAVPATLGAALDDMEALILGQARASAASGDGDDLAGTGSPAGDGGPGAALIAVSSPGTEPRLRAILKAGQPLGVTAVILGPWPSGATCQVEADGTITTATPPGAGLDGIRLFTLDAAEAAAITSVLREAVGGPPPGPGDHPGGTDGRPAGHGALPETAARDGQDSYLAAPPAPAPPRSAPAPPDDPAAVFGPAGKPPARTAPQAHGTRPVRLAVLGPLRVTARGAEISGGLRKARELLAFLAVHPGGATGEAISEALWPGADARQAAAQRYLAVRKARDLLRAAAGQAAPMWITHAAGSYRLDPALIATDLEEFEDALGQARRAGDNGTRLNACRAAVALYRGELAEGAGYEWAEPHAETARRRALDAWTAIADILQPAEPDQALAALEAALAHDPFNEFLYQKIMRLQAAAGRPEAVRRTLALLESRLTQIGISPGTQTRQVAAQLLGGTSQPATPRRAGSADQ